MLTKTFSGWYKTLSFHLLTTLLHDGISQYSCFHLISFYFRHKWHLSTTSQCQKRPFLSVSCLLLQHSDVYFSVKSPTSNVLTDSTCTRSASSESALQTPYVRSLKLFQDYWCIVRYLASSKDVMYARLQWLQVTLLGSTVWQLQLVSYSESNRYHWHLALH